ncbi:MAG: fructose-bisphosphatase class II family protein [Candidatus Bathyarchaeota archaeon]|nr:fructose-bisphosphatase class II family protein [Candidatus Bathyarchaeota archaeon]
MVSLRTLAPSLTRITIAAAVGAALHIGQGNPKIVDQRAVDFSRALLSQMEIDGEVISCEGPKDNAPAFTRREKVGIGHGPKVEFVMDPVDGTTATSKGRKDAISALACAPKGCLQVLPDDGYYFKVATDYRSKGKISLEMSIEEIVQVVAEQKKMQLQNFTVIMLERERHREMLERLRKLGVRIILIPDGDIAASVVTCIPKSGVDLLIGAGAGPEATIGATAVKCLGGTMLVKVWRDRRDDAKRLEQLEAEGVDVEKTYSEMELAKGNELVFAASGVTKGELLDGVRFIPNGAIVNSLCVRLPSGTFEKSETMLRFKGHPVYKQLTRKR